MPEKIQNVFVRVGDEIHVEVFFRPVVPLKYICVKVQLNMPMENVKLKTRFQILKECF